MVTVTLLAAPVKLPVIVVAEIIPTVIPVSLITVPVPIPIVLFCPSIVTEDPPTVKIPVMRASPFTHKVVPDDPTAPTSNVYLGFVVPIPTLLVV